MKAEVNFSKNKENTGKFQKNTREIKCSKCQTSLGNLLIHNKKLPNNYEKHTHIFVCPCGGESFEIKTEFTSTVLLNEGLAVESSEQITLFTFLTRIIKV